MKHAAAGAADFEPTGAVPGANAGFFGSAGRDPIATIRTLIRVVCPNATSNNVASSMTLIFRSERHLCVGSISLMF